MTRYTYIPSRDRSPTPEPEKPKYYYSYEKDSAGRLMSAPPKEARNCHCHQQEKLAAPSPSHPYVCYDVGNSNHLHGSPAYIYYPGLVETAKHEPKCVCDTHPADTPNVPAYCLPELQSKKAEDAPVVHVPRNVTYSYPAHGQTAGQYYHPHYMCFDTGYGQAVPNAIPWQGSSKEEVDVQNRVIHYEHQDQVVPYQEAAPADHQYWCKELDGSFTLRTLKEIGEQCKSGHWQLSKENYWYWVRD